MKTLRLILGDQLNTQISSLSDCDKEKDIIFMCEVWDEATYVKHHKKKIVLLFSAMRHFSNLLKKEGYQVHYVKLNSKNSGSFTDEVGQFCKGKAFDKFIVTESGEYRVNEILKKLDNKIKAEVEIREDDRFYCSINEFKKWAKNRKTLRLETFYREMRKKYQILMDGESPEGGAWNYDNQNRQPPKENLKIPAPYQAKGDDIVEAVIKLVEKRFSSHFGDIEPFHYAVTREQALYALDKFIKERLSSFGEYQDAMVENEPWMYHSHLSFYLNCGLLLPKEVIEAAEKAYYKKQAPLNAVEGFIRQILGWREFIRGIYWLAMPDYVNKNAMRANRDLPAFFWDGDTKLNCIKQSVLATKNHAYAHHIQRLMVIGNFMLLAGIEPKQVSEWFLIVYADAYEWVELPNVMGMILYADSGLFASKPYAASGAYINKMSDYCKSCDYNVKEKNGQSACPFNYLYWDFFIRHKKLLESNPRLGFCYKIISKMSDDKKQAVKKDSETFLSNLK